MAGKIKIDPKAWIQNIIDFFKNFKYLPKDEKLAWLVISIGILLIILGLIW